jgi:hypothetical protein
VAAVEVHQRRNGKRERADCRDSLDEPDEQNGSVRNIHDRWNDSKRKVASRTESGTDGNQCRPVTSLSAPQTGKADEADKVGGEKPLTGRENRTDIAALSSGADTQRNDEIRDTGIEQYLREENGEDDCAEDQSVSVSRLHVAW